MKRAAWVYSYPKISVMKSFNLDMIDSLHINSI